MTRRSIAIVGIGCRLPGARSASELAASLGAPPATFAPLPPDRWDPRAFGPPAHGALLTEHEIDSRAFRVPPAVATSLHRMERAAMAAMHAALLDAGLTPGSIERAERTQIHVGATTLGLDPAHDHMARVRLPEARRALGAAVASLGGGRDAARAAILAALDEAAPPITVDSLMTTAAVTAGRVANAFDLGGGHLAYDVGPASSLAALAGAARALASGECDLAIAAGISPLVTATQVLAHVRRGLAARRAASIAGLGDEPDGTVLGEGVVALVLARLDDARAEARRVYAVVRGAGARSAGRRGASRAIADGTGRAVKLALAEARLDAGAVDLVECQCAGLPGIDPLELDALASAYQAAGRSAPLAIASIAPRLGWLGAASGMASVASAALAIAAGRAHGAEPRAVPSASGVALSTGGGHAVRAAAVSSPGFGQVIHHAVLAHPDVPWASARGAPRSGSAEPASIVGVGVRAPGAPDAPALYQLLAEGRCVVDPMPAERFRFEDHDPALAAGGAPRTALAGTVAIPVADPLRLRVPPIATRWVDGAVVLAFDACEEALDAFGWRAGALDPERVGVWVGHLAIRAAELESERAALVARSVAVARGALARAGVEDEPLVSALERALGEGVLPITEDTLETTSSLACAARVASRWDVRGPIAAIDAGCASSLVALHAACGALLRHEVDLAIVCGVAWNLFPDYYAALATLGALSFRGSRPFEGDADGMVPAEGAAAVVLERRSDALRHRRRVRATIRGTAIAGDGRGTTIFAPNVAGQDRALRRAYAAAGVEPATVDVFEAHGTGTPTGDPVELSAIDALLMGARRPAPKVGSAKSNIGHLSSAAGMIGLIKTTFALERRFVLPTVHSGELRGAHEALASGRLALALEGEAWRAPDGGHPRRAGVSAFGLGGIDAHVVLEEPIEGAERRRARPPSVELDLEREGARTATRLAPELVPVALPVREAVVSREGETVLVLTDEGGAITDEIFPQLHERGLHAILFDVEGLAPEVVEERVRALDVEHAGIGALVDLSVLGAARAAAAADTSREVEEATRAARRSFAIARALWPTLSGARDAGRELAWITATAMGGSMGLLPGSGVGAGGAIAGFLKSLKQDLPWIVARAVDVDPTEDPDWIARVLVAELEAGGDRVECGWLARRRVVPVVRPAPYAPGSKLELGAGTVLFSGGSRGVVLECARALARRGVTTVATGRTAPAAGDEEWARASDDALGALHAKELLERRGDVRAIRDAKAAHQERLRRRALLHALEDAASRGEPLEYRRVDMLDAASVAALVAELRARPGGLLGVVHGAMTSESRAIERATYASFDATLRTKLDGLAALLAAIGDEPPSFVLAFGSISGRFGYPSHEDYAAANDAMARILARWAADHPGCHAATIDWTAWSEVGAAADPSIAGLVRQLGVVPLPKDEGTRWLIDEIERGAGREPMVVIANEGHVRSWPFALSVSDAAGRAPTRFDDRGQPLDAASLPLVDVLFGEEADHERVVERELAPGVDGFLRDHHVRGAPVLPGTFALELLAEAALAAHGADASVVAMTGLSIETPLRFAHDAPATVRVHARRDGEEVVVRASLAVALPRALSQERAYCAARARLGPLPPLAGALTTAPDAPDGAGRSLFDALHRPISLGPHFRLIEWVARDDGGATGAIRPPSHGDAMARTSAPDLVLDPFVLDAALQIAAHWDALRPGGWISVPVAVERLELHARRREGSWATARARVREERETEVVYDVVIEALDGAPLSTMAGVVLRRIEPAPEVR